MEAAVPETLDRFEISDRRSIRIFIFRDNLPIYTMI
jgi:hypothetical protein